MTRAHSAAVACVHLFSCLGQAGSLHVSSFSNSSASPGRVAAGTVTSSYYATCSDVPGTTDGYYMLKPPSSGISVASNEDVAVPSAGVSVYCRFEGGRAWALVGTFNDGMEVGMDWATTGSWDYSTSPAPDETTSGVTARFPLKFWNDLAHALPDGAITYTSSIYLTESGGTYDICPGFWKTSCQVYSAHQAHTPECAEPWRDYSADGDFSDQQMDRSGGQHGATGYTNGHGAILGHSGLGVADRAGSWYGSVMLTAFQLNIIPPHGIVSWNQMGKCLAGTNTIVNSEINRGFMLWIGGPYSGGGATPAAGGSGGGAAAVGDPHLQNVHGERFDLMQAGKHVLINIPRGTSSESALLRVQADARRLGGHCADIYFQELNVTGSWAEAKQAGGYHYSVSQSDVATPGWVAFGKVELKIVHGRTDSALRYLNVYVKHLGGTGFAVGGLLGEDDHADVITPPAACANRMSLVGLRVGDVL